MNSAEDVKKDLKKLSNSKKAKIYQRFFKTGPGQYGEGDIFIGLTGPEQGQVAKKYSDLTLRELQKLITSKIHEHRAVSLIILKQQYKKGDCGIQDRIAKFYLKNKDHINNWDLVDISAPHILGHYLLDKDKSVLYQLVKSDSLWDRRISIISTYTFIKAGKFSDTKKLAVLLLKDTHDLIHKAVGWMLREMGKQNKAELLKFLDKYATKLPRTALRYSLEKLSEKKRKYYMQLK